jgi:competence protein ComGC
MSFGLVPMLVVGAFVVVGVGLLFFLVAITKDKKRGNN